MSKFVFRKELRGVDAYTRHKKLLRSYESYKGAATSQSNSSYNPEHAILRQHHKFVISPDDLADDETITWEQRIAKKYYDQLFKEYALCELSRYKQGQIALRWRTENEVVMGKGQFICGSTQCEDANGLTSWEVNFGYLEDGVKKNELVKVRLCPDCSNKLNYNTMKRKSKKMDVGKRKRRNSVEDGYSGDESSAKRKRKSRSGKQSDNDDDDSDNNSDSEQKKNEASIWSKDLNEKDDKTKEEEFEDYFADLLQ